MARLGFSHDPGTAQPGEFAEACRDTIGWPPETLAGRNLANSMAALFAIVYGISPAELIELQITSGCPHEDASVALDLEAGVLWRHLPRIAHDYPLGVTPRWSRPGSPWASIPALPLVRAVMHVYAAHVPKLRQGDHIFSSAGNMGNSVGELLPDQPRLLARLARSTHRWLRQCGLPSVVAATISGRFDMTTLSTSAYANFADTQVARSHATACARFFEGIREEAIARGP
jgi:hypothetical protein